MFVPIKNFQISVVCLILFYFSFSDQENQGKVKVAVYYEALCPDSVNFFNLQLKNAYPIIGDRISLEFIPYGKANHRKNTNGRWLFSCHHGNNECYANQIQACAVHQNVSQEAKVDFLTCLMSSPRRFGVTNPSVIEKCATDNSLSPDDIFNCMRGELKEELLAKHGDRTQAVDPIITFVPTVIFNDVYDAYKQNDALEDFLGTVCEQLTSPPENCRRRQIKTFWLFR